MTVYGRRRGKTLRRTPRALLDGLLPGLTLTLPQAGEAVDLAALFPRPVREVWLEIGFGGGEHLAAQAAARPDVGLIGCEFFVNGVASLLRHVEAAGLSNIRIFPDDARRLLPVLPVGAISRAFVLFPDPWPKKRHAERRFVNPANLDALARVLADAAELRIASDDPGYVAWTLARLGEHAGFDGPRRGAAGDFERPADGVVTRYEGKALAAGRAPVYLGYRRKMRRAGGEDGDKGLVSGR